MSRVGEAQYAAHAIAIGAEERGNKCNRNPLSRYFSPSNFAAGSSSVKDASGGPAGGHTFEKFDKQVFIHDSNLTSNQRRM